MRAASPTGWHDDFRYRLRFEASARSAYPSLHSTRTGHASAAEIVYTLMVAVPEYREHRLVRVRFANLTRPYLVAVTVDGPTESKHRYADGSLCMWSPDDGPGLQWHPEERLLGLIQYVRVHLFREAYWREYDYWPGPEAPHTDTKDAA